MKVSRGDVILVDFPFASGTGQKLRPAVVVQNDSNNRRLATTILAPITSNARHQNEPTQVAVEPNSPEGAVTGLLRPSSIKCENLATVETRLVRRKIGVTPPSVLTEVEAALKSSLALS
jgi:mRNA interferase MazF